MTTSEHLPDWLPASVRAMAELTGYGDDVSTRLLTDRRMEKVWSKLGGEPLKPDAWTVLKENMPVGSLIEHLNYPLAEIVPGAVYFICAHEMRTKFVATGSQVSKSVQEWRDHAILCRSIGSVDHAPDRDPELAKALERTAQHFEQLADWLEHRAGPRWLKYGHDTNSGHDPIARARTSALISEVDRLYQASLRTPLATMASVALGKKIEPKTIDNWRKSLRTS